MIRASKNRRIAVLAADGFEKVELAIPVAALKAAGAEVDIVSLRRGRIRGVNLHEPASRVRVTRTIEEASPGRYDALLVPGGFINPDLLRQSAAARAFVTAFDRSHRAFRRTTTSGCVEAAVPPPGRWREKADARSMASSVCWCICSHVGTAPDDPRWRLPHRNGRKTIGEDHASEV